MDCSVHDKRVPRHVVHVGVCPNILFDTMYIREIIYVQYRESHIDIFKRLCKFKGVDIIEGDMRKRK